MLRVVVEAFKAHGYNPIIVGGVAVQMHIVSLIGPENAEKYLRETHDYDMVVLGVENEKVEEIMGALNNTFFASENIAFSIKVLRNGGKRPVLEFDRNKNSKRKGQGLQRCKQPY